MLAALWRTAERMLSGLPETHAAPAVIYRNVLICRWEMMDPSQSSAAGIWVMCRWGERTESLSPASSLPVPLLSSCLASHSPPCRRCRHWSLLSDTVPPRLCHVFSLTFLPVCMSPLCFCVSPKLYTLFISSSFHSICTPPSTTTTTSQTPRWYMLVEIARLRRKGENRRVVKREGGEGKGRRKREEWRRKWKERREGRWGEEGGGGGIEKADTGLDN